MLFGLLGHLVDDSLHHQFAAMCFLNLYLAGSLARLTVGLSDAQAQTLLKQVVVSLRSQLLTFAAGEGP